MSCIKNPKSFLFIKWYGPHEVVDTYIKPMLSDAYYELHQECKVCGVDLGYDIVTENYLVHRGYNAKKLQAMSFSPTNLGKSPEKLV